MSVAVMQKAFLLLLICAVAALDKLEEFNTCSFDGEKGRPCQNAFRQVYPQLVGDCGNFTKYMRCLKTACGDIPALLFPNLKAAGLNKTETATCDLKEFGDSDAGDGGGGAGGGAGGGGDGGAGGGGGGGGSGGIKLQSSIMVLLTTISLIYCI